jgi:hypothetical protein
MQFARKHKPVEVDKAPEHRGKYLHPYAFDKPSSEGIGPKLELIKPNEEGTTPQLHPANATGSQQRDITLPSTPRR